MLKPRDCAAIRIYQVDNSSAVQCLDKASPSTADAKPPCVCFLNGAAGCSSGHFAIDNARATAASGVLAKKANRILAVLIQPPPENSKASGKAGQRLHPTINVPTAQHPDTLSLCTLFEMHETFVTVPTSFPDDAIFVDDFHEEKRTF